jgi:hypothetical protein
MNTTLSYSSPFNVLEPFEGNVDMKMTWDTTTAETLTSNDVAYPLATLFHLTVPYTSSISKTLRRATGWIFSASEPDYASDNILISNGGIQKASEENMISAVVVYEVMGMENGVYSLHALSKCPNEKHNKWLVRLPGDKRLTWSMPTYGEVEELQWDVFEGTLWEVQSPGQKVRRMKGFFFFFSSSTSHTLLWLTLFLFSLSLFFRGGCLVPTILCLLF